MSESKHTPGPWTAKFDPQLRALIQIYSTEAHLPVAVLPDRGTVEAMPEIEANANLIADAWQLPDLRREISELKAINKEMYEALETIDETYKYRRIPDIRRKGHTILKDEIRGGAVFTYDDIKKVREALRKARGEEE